MTAAPISSLRLQIVPSTESNDDQVRILIDEVDALNALSAEDLGIDPIEFFAQPALREGGQLLVSRCSCGVIGCGDGVASVTLSPSKVVWNFLYTPPLRYCFDRNSYFQEIERAQLDFSWEDYRRHMERLVNALDFSSLAQKQLRYYWASGRILPDTISLSFFHLKTHQQELVHLPWKSAIPSDAVETVLNWIKQQGEPK